MLRFKEGVIPKYTKKEFKILEEKQRVEPVINDAYENINEFIYMLLRKYPAKYKYEKTVFCDELSNGEFLVYGMKFKEFEKYLMILSQNQLPKCETKVVNYNNKSYRIPELEISKVLDICAKLDKLFAQTDYDIDELSNIEDLDKLNDASIYSQRHL